MTFTFEASDHLGSLAELQCDDYIAEYTSSHSENGNQEGEIRISPDEATEAKPGSKEKVRKLAARYAAGLPLWHNEDCYDHAPHIEVDFENGGERAIGN